MHNVYLIFLEIKYPPRNYKD